MAYVPMANEQMASGVLDQIEHQALALESTVRTQQSEITVQKQRTVGMQEESRRMEVGAEDERRRAMGDGASEFDLYTSVALEALGGPLAKLAKDGFDFMSDMDPGKGVMIGGKKVDTFEDMIKGANRTPGVYNDKPAKAADAPDDGAITLTEKANLTGQSLAGQSDVNLNTWSMRSADMPSTEMQQNLIFGQQLASEAALTSVRRARMMQAPSMGGPGGQSAASMMYPPVMAATADLTMSLASGPKPPSFEGVDEESMVG